MTHSTLHAIGKALEREKKDCPNFDSLHIGGKFLYLSLAIAELAKICVSNKYGKQKESLNGVVVRCIAILLRLLKEQ